jgi:hypothetical protein
MESQAVHQDTRSISAYHEAQPWYRINHRQQMSLIHELPGLTTGNTEFLGRFLERDAGSKIGR